MLIIITFNLILTTFKFSFFFTNLQSELLFLIKIYIFLWYKIYEIMCKDLIITGFTIKMVRSIK